MGPCPMQLVVVSAVRNAVRAATIIFTATSMNLFRFIEKKKYTFKFLRIDVQIDENLRLIIIATSILFLTSICENLNVNLRQFIFMIHWCAH